MKKILALLFILTSIITSAQINFEKGYYISNSGEKIECFIKNVDWLNNPVSFSYKKNSTDAVALEETITNVSEFGIDNNCKFIRATVKIDYSSTTINQLPKSKNPVWNTETLFLKTIIEGDVSLYYYSTKDIRRYFFKTSTYDGINQLVYLKYLSEEDNSQILVNELYKSQLYSSLVCSAITPKDIESLTYTKKSLVKIIEKYNICKEGTVSVNYDSKDSKKQTVFVKLNSHFNFASLDIVDPNEFLNLSTEIKNKFIVKFGIEAEYILPFNNNKWSLFLNPSYHKFKTEQNFVNNDGLGIHSQDVTHTATTEYSVIEIPVGFRYYSFLNAKSKLFYNVGYVFKIDMGDSNIAFDNTSVASTNLKINSRNNFALGIGYGYKKWSLEYRLNTPSQILGGYISWSGKYSTNGLIVGYTIF